MFYLLVNDFFYQRSDIMRYVNLALPVEKSNCWEALLRTLLYFDTDNGASFFSGK